VYNEQHSERITPTDVFFGRPRHPAARNRGQVACWLLTGDYKNNFSGLSLKTAKKHTIYMKVLSASAARPVMFDPDAGMPRLNRSLVYVGACLIAGIRLARERQVNVRVSPTGKAIEESVELAHEIYNRIFRIVPQKVTGE